MKKFYVVNEGQIVFGPASKAKAKLEAENMREAAIVEQLKAWGYEDPDDWSEKRIAEAAFEIGAEGELFEVVEESKLNEEVCSDE